MLDGLNTYNVKEIISEKIKGFFESFNLFLFQPKSIFPLITFRILFGILMCYGTARFIYNGWVDKLFIEPKHFFKFYGFEWVEVLSPSGMYYLQYLIALVSFFIAIGFLYRISIITFFLAFTYVELIDATNYLNHYYLVILLSIILIFVPANANFSIDSKLFPRIKKYKIPAWCINIIIFQLCITYFFAGFAKLNYDWMFRAMPLSIWLPEHLNIPLFGFLFKYQWTAYLFSWTGAFYDLTIWAFLLHYRTRDFAYIFVVLFHLMTWYLFNIGLFPLIMITSTLIFFSDKWHERIYNYFMNVPVDDLKSFKINKPIKIIVAIYMIFQILFPLRSFLYKGNVLWHEQGYRFSWRVMVVEKSGTAIFRIKDLETGKESEIQNNKYLTKFQEKQMTIQPDFILQYAKIIQADYEKRFNIKHAEIKADVFVALNKRVSSRFIDNNINLLEIKNSFKEKEWILEPIK